MNKVLTKLYHQHVDQTVANHQALLAKYDYDFALVPSGELQTIYMDDMQYPFKTNAHFKWLTPFTREPNCFVVIPQSGKPSLLFYQPRDYWHVVPQDPPAELVQPFDFVSVSTIKDIKSELSRLVESNKVAFLGKKPRKFKLPENYEIYPEKLSDELHWLRAYKSEYEKACLYQASLKGVRSHIAARDAFYQGGSEMDIHHAYLQASGGQENDLPYSNIIALNEHAAVLHYHELETRVFAENERRSFLIDAGGCYNGYASDITRTYSYRDDEFADLINYMDFQQMGIIEAIMPGNSYIDLHRLSHEKVAEALIEFNLINCSVEAAIEMQVTTPFFPHGLGHQIGLYVHDIGGHQAGPIGGRKEPPPEHPYLRNTRQIEIDQFVTIEPGLYFIPQLLSDLKAGGSASLVNWDKVEQFLPFGGIRIEDDVLVTESGAENYTRKAFAEIA